MARDSSLLIWYKDYYSIGRNVSLCESAGFVQPMHLPFLRRLIYCSFYPGVAGHIADEMILL